MAWLFDYYHLSHLENIYIFHIDFHNMQYSFAFILVVKMGFVLV